MGVNQELGVTTLDIGSRQQVKDFLSFMERELGSNHSLVRMVMDGLKNKTEYGRGRTLIPIANAGQKELTPLLKLINTFVPAHRVGQDYPGGITSA